MLAPPVRGLFIADDPQGIRENARGQSLYVRAQFRYVPEQPRQLFRLFVLAEIMMVGRLVMMVGGGVMMSGGLMMVLTGRMFR